MIIIKIFYGLLFIWAWFLILKYRKTVIWWTWKFFWAEKYIWNWGTYFIIMLIWIFCIFLWLLYPFWWLELIFGSAKDIIKK